VLELAPIPFWTVCPDGHAVVADPYGKRLIRYDAGGRITRTDTLPLEGRATTEEDIVRYIRNAGTITEIMRARPTEEQVQQVIRDFLATRRGEISTVGPPLVRLACDERNRLWLQQFDTADEPRGLGREWAVVTNGRIAARYRFPARFQPMAFRNRAAYGIHKDSLDTERVARVPIPPAQ
jgi:hypothetical protein